MTRVDNLFYLLNYRQLLSKDSDVFIIFTQALTACCAGMQQFAQIRWLRRADLVAC